LALPKPINNRNKEKNKKQQEELVRDVSRTAAALSAAETVERFGSANAEFIKGYAGLDNEAGLVFDRSLKKIYEYKVNPEYANQNIKQQAGFSAEVAATSRDNAEAIINKSDIRTVRSEDVSGYGKNHPVVDRVQLLDGRIIDGSESQMKFVANRDDLFRKIASDNGKFSRYRGSKLELPSEQYEGAKEFCLDKAQKLRQQAETVAEAGKADVAEKLRREADNYTELAGNVRDSGLTTEEAIFYRKYPELATALDIGRTSHRAGVDAAKIGIVIGGMTTLIQNSIAVAQGKKELGEAAKDTVIGTGKAAALGYSTGFAGSAIKGAMQQSPKGFLRAIAKTNLPTLIVSTCVSLAVPIKKLVCGEIDGTTFLQEIGEKGSSMLSAGMYAAVGQLLIPIPIVGGVIGGMIGHALSSVFYKAAVESGRRVKQSREELQRIREIEKAARIEIDKQQALLDEFVRNEIPELKSYVQEFTSMLDGYGSVDEMAAGVNKIASLLGRALEFQSNEEFCRFMEADISLQL